MIWIIPKTNWNNSEWFEISDWNRIKGNIEYIQDLISELYPNYSVLSVPIIPIINRQTLFIPSLHNAIEDNFELIGMHVPISFISVNTRKFFDNNNTWDFNDLNRIESITFQYHNAMISQRANIPTLEFELGGDFFGGFYQ